MYPVNKFNPSFVKFNKVVIFISIFLGILAFIINLLVEYGNPDFMDQWIIYKITNGVFYSFLSIVFSLILGFGLLIISFLVRIFIALVKDKQNYNKFRKKEIDFKLFKTK